MPDDVARFQLEAAPPPPPRPEWPALMKPATLRAYLDCGSDSAFARVLKVLEQRGYPGMDPHLHRHIKAVVDRFLDPAVDSAAARKRDMLERARGAR